MEFVEGRSHTYPLVLSLSKDVSLFAGYCLFVKDIVLARACFDKLSMSGVRICGANVNMGGKTKANESYGWHAT
jgi:hypothetical protein